MLDCVYRSVVWGGGQEVSDSPGLPDLFWNIVFSNKCHVLRGTLFFCLFVLFVFKRDI